MPENKVAIGTWPTPEKSLAVEIQTRLLKEFGEDTRFVFKFPGPVGIVSPDLIINPELSKQIDSAGFEVMIIPKNLVWK